MISFSHLRSPRLAAFTLSLWLSGAAMAQSPLIYPRTSPLGDARAAEARNDPAEALARYLRVLASNPRSLDALTGAGRAALDIEDPNAAVGFYGRAEEIAPRDGRVKAGLASALVQLEQPAEALRLFQAAVSLGVPESAIAGDRGLAYDLRGDGRRAQADYQLSLRSRYDAEVTRRLAVSQAISGDRAAALQTLDPLLRQQNKAAWRTRTFVHALTGDAAGAAQLADSLMPPIQAAQMKPFLARIAGLAPSAKAMAVHFGHFPNTSYGSVAMAQALPFPGAQQQPMPAISAPGRAVIVPPAPDPRRLSRREQRDLTRTRDAEQRRVTVARDAEQRRLAQEAEQRRIADARLAEDRRLAQLRQFEQQRLAEQQRLMEQQRLAEQRRAAEAQEAQRRAAAAQAIVLAPSSQPTPLGSPMGLVRPSQSPSMASGAFPTAAAPAGGSPVSPVAGAPEPAFASLTRVAPTANPYPASAVLTTQPAPAVRPVDLPPSAAGPRRAGPQVTTASALTTVPAPASRMASAPAGDVPRVETRAVPRLASVPEATTERPVLRTAAQRRAGQTADAQARRGDEGAPAKTGKAKGAKEQLASTDLKADASGAKLDKTGVAKKGDKDAKGAKNGKLAAKGEDEKGGKAKAKEPSRVWVQVSGGADKRALPRDWSKLKARYGDLFAGQSAWTTPLRATNRLLVGPFKSFNASQEFVNKANKAGLPSFTFTSDEGQAIEKIGAN